MPPMQTWNCSVSRRWKTARGPSSDTHGGRTMPAGSGSRERGANRVSIACTSGSCSRFPAAATTMFGPT